MKKFRSGYLLLGVLVLVLILVSACDSTEQAGEDSYPEKPVEVIVGFSPGGGTDTSARLVFQYAEKYFGQSFAVVNKTGASGEIAWTELANAKPDGYTIGFINPPTFVSHPIQRPDCQYKVADFKPIANIVTDPACLVVRSDSDVSSVPELYEKAKDASVAVGYSGPGTSESLLLRQVEDIIGVNLEKIPYDGSAPAVVALLGGDIEAVTMNVSEAIKYTNDGSLKLIAVASRNRVPEYPDVETMEEQGLKIYNEAYRGIAAPAGVPDEYIKKLEDAIEKAVNDPEFLEKAKTQNLPLNYIGSEEYKKVLDEMAVMMEEEVKKGEW